MFLGENIQYLRRKNGLTQETLAQRLGVSRQTVSKWESGEALPELTKLPELGDVFGCKLDTLLREDLAERERRYSQVRVVRVAGFRLAQYVVISPQPEADAAAHLERWARNAGVPDTAASIGWAFPQVTAEQKSRFGLRGYGAGLILPEDFSGEGGSVELVSQSLADYAMLTVWGKADALLPQLSQAVALIFDYLGRNGLRKSAGEGVLPCFHRLRQEAGEAFLDVFVHCQGAVSPPEYHL